MAKEDRIAFRTSEELRGRFAACAKRVKLNESQLGEACIEALVEYIETNGNVTHPLATLPLSVLQKIVGAEENAEAREIYARLRKLMHDAIPSFSEAGAKIGAGVGGSFTSSTRVPHTDDIDTSLRLNEEPATAARKGHGPHPRSTKPGITKTVSLKKGKTGS
jgi:hypothetical protein